MARDCAFVSKSSLHLRTRATGSWKVLYASKTTGLQSGHSSEMAPNQPNLMQALGCSCTSLQENSKVPLRLPLLTPSSHPRMPTQSTQESVDSLWEFFDRAKPCAFVKLKPVLGDARKKMTGWMTMGQPGQEPQEGMHDQEHIHERRHLLRTNPKPSGKRVIFQGLQLGWHMGEGNYDNIWMVTHCIPYTVLSGFKPYLKNWGSTPLTNHLLR